MDYKEEAINEARKNISLILKSSPNEGLLSLAIETVHELANVLNSYSIKADYEQEDIRAEKMADCQNKVMEIQQNLCEVMGRELNDALLGEQELTRVQEGDS